MKGWWKVFVLGIIGSLVVQTVCGAVALKKEITDDAVFIKPNSKLIASPEDLAKVLENTQEQFLPISPPSMEMFIAIQEKALAVDWNRFPSDFLRFVFARMDKNSGVPVYRIRMYEDVITRERVFVNSRGFEFFRLPPPKGYNPLMWRNRILHIESDAGIKEKRRSSALTSSALFSWVFDPAHTAVEVTLVPRIFYADYLKANPPLPVLMPMRGKSGSSDEVVSISSGSNSVVSLSVVWPLDGGNRAEIFRSENLMDSNDWEVVVNAIPATGGVSLVWSDPNSTNRTTAFYVVSDATIDADHDGFSDARERLITHTPTNQFNFVDSDNDGLHDWYEISFFGDLSESGTNDFDGDGLVNTQEWVLTSTSVEIICDPMNVDTDGDGTDDGVEYNQGSDPSDPGDEGNPPPPVTNTTTKVTMSIQGSYEQGTISLTMSSGTNSYSVTSTGTDVASNTFDVVQGVTYALNLSSTPLDLSYSASLSGNGIIIHDDYEDENGVLGDYLHACGVDTSKTAAVDVIKVDMSVYSSDTNTYKIASVLEGGKDHFVCVKNTGDIILEAKITNQ